MVETFDVVVIGAGTGGYSTALRSAQLGQRVALIERDDRIGGTCLLRGCIPTKALLQSAAVLDTVDRAGEWGIDASGKPDWAKIVEFEDRVVDKLVKGVTGLVKARGIEVIQGTATLVAGPAIVVESEGSTRRVDATNVVIATGSAPRLLPGVEVSEHIITSDQALAYERIPSSVVVIGAGAVGLEFASMYRSFGADVTLLEALPALAPLEDAEVSKEIARAYRKRGITTATGASVEGIADTGSGAEVSYRADGHTTTVSADVCLVAIGRGPVTSGLDLESAGVSVHEKGFVQVDASLRTDVPGVWAIGDVAATPLQLAHVSFDEGYAVAERIAGLDVPEIDYINIPRVTYCTPEIASVGLTEAQSRERGGEVAIEKLDLRGIGKANILGEGGFVKIVAEASPSGHAGTVLGIHMIGPHVTDLIAEGMLVTNWEGTVDDVAVMHHPHPSLSEGLGEAMLALAGKPLHSA